MVQSLPLPTTFGALSLKSFNVFLTLLLYFIQVVLRSLVHIHMALDLFLVLRCWRLKWMCSPYLKGFTQQWWRYCGRVTFPSAEEWNSKNSKWIPEGQPFFPKDTNLLGFFQILQSTRWIYLVYLAGTL
jgi:hypothetical protein